MTLGPILACALAATAIDPGGGQALKELAGKPYLELFEGRSSPVTAADVAAFRQRMDKDKTAEQDRLRAVEKEIRRRADQARKQLEALNRERGPDTEDRVTRRRSLHCELLTLERDLATSKTAREKGVPVAFENRIAKAEIAEHWPAERAAILARIQAGQARERRFGDVEDIGVRKISSDQDHDIKLGKDVIQEMKSYGLMPPEGNDPKLKEYVDRLGAALAARSDLRVPLKVAILESPEVNAFMLPGGFLFVNTGLLEQTATESELAGVMAHEIAHAAARHGHRMMKRATVANIVFQSAQVAALILAGGAVGIGAYYGMQYGFYGLGMLLELSLLGVNREFEAEADQLGAQYAWSAGYDPAGFVTFFDKMAREQGYARSASFFRTHPPFADRILATFSEMLYLPAKPDLRLDSSEFQQIKMYRKAKDKSDPRKRPALRPFPECDPGLYYRSLRIMPVSVAAINSPEGLRASETRVADAR